MTIAGQVAQCLANIESAAANLKSFSLQTQDQQAKQMFQQLSQMTFFDFISGITLGSIAGIAASDLTVGWEAWVALVFWTGLTILSASLALYSRKVRKLLDGEPTIPVHRGKILEGNLGKVRYTVDDLRAQLRAKNAFSFSDVEYAILETTGELSVMKSPLKEPPSRQEMGLRGEYTGIETELVVDGEIVRKNLKDLNKDEVWLRAMLKAYGVEFISEVFYCSLDERGHLFVDKYEDHLGEVRDPSDYKLDAWVNMDREDRR
ncbi:MAG: hypothetical protein DDT20_01003 [Firmicutes bacterium]|nr:hypothetical protein [Bacillota bacterium]